MRPLTTITATAAALFLLTACESSSSDDPAPDGGLPNPAPECRLDADCLTRLPDGDIDPCKRATCDAALGRCSFDAVDDGTPCDDDDACTRADHCAAGLCRGGAPLDCDDGNPCTQDECSAALGCLFKELVAACDDGNPCTEGDSCSAGVCQGGENTCNCAEDADCAEFDDGDLCNGRLRCEGVCVVDEASVIVCNTDDDGPCRATRCEPSSGDCVAENAPDGTACDDGNQCSVGDRCLAGSCDDGEARSCDDGIDCTVDSCRPGIGCVSIPGEGCEACSGLSCSSCGRGELCAEGDALIDGTCCALGDNLLYLGRGSGDEVVDIEDDGEFAYLCGGFGVSVNEVRSPTRAELTDRATDRCQHIGIGPERPGRGRTIYLTHHGDTWVRRPFLKVFDRDVDGKMTELQSLEEPGVLYEGVLWHRGHLYVAAHSAGLRVYRADEEGRLEALTNLVEGLENPIKLAAHQQWLYIADGAGGLAVVDIEDPAAPRLVDTQPTHGNARDVDFDSGRVYVALGGAGVDIFDATEPAAPRLERQLEVRGSAQAVSAEGTRLAVASWSRFALYEATSGALIGTEDLRLFPRFDQVLGVSMRDDTIFVGEWEGLHVLQHRQGRVAPDIWVDQEIYDFPGETLSAASVIVRNLGRLDLEVSDVRLRDAAFFSVAPTRLSIPPGGADVLEVTYTPPTGGSSLRSSMTLRTNDPDPGQNEQELHLIAGRSDALDVGDTLGPQFGFLDPTGAGQLNGLRGHVVVLAYFALF